LRNLISLEKTLPAEIDALKTILAVCEPQQRQAILDEVEGKRRAGQVKIGIFPLAASLVRAVASGTFMPSAGVAVAAARQAAAVVERRIVDARASGDIDPATLDPEIIAKLPPTI
jgi:transposase